MEPASITAIVVIVLLTGLLGLVAAAETALERANDVRIQALAARGDERARRIAGDVQPRAFLGPLTLARVMSAAAIATLFAFLGVKGWGTEGAIGLGLVGGLFVALVEMTVGLLVARQPEYAALYLSRVARITGRVLKAPAWLMGLPSRLLARSLQAVTPEREIDILALVEREEAQGGVEEQGRRMIRGIIALEDKTVREIMVPRIDIAAADDEDSPTDVARLCVERGLSRVPIYHENIDDIVGITYAKDLLQALTNGGRAKTLRDMLREPMFIPESKRLDELLTEMRAGRTHMAIVVDEYGGTAGLVTIEDLLEEIVGEITDEYDVAQSTMEVISDDEVVLDAGVGTYILQELFDYEVESEDFDTVGGFVIHELGRLPSVGDEIQVDGLTLRVLSMAGRRIRRLRITREQSEEMEEARARG
jgi:putative hemolysin